MEKYSLTICTVRTVRGKDLRIVRTVRTENGFTDRTNRTVREMDSRIVYTAFQSVKESVCDLVKHGKIRPSARMVRTVRTESVFTDRAYCTVCEKDLRIVNTVFNR